MFICRTWSTGWRAGLSLALAQALLAPGAAAADPAPGLTRCTAEAPASASAAGPAASTGPVAKGPCTKPPGHGGTTPPPVHPAQPTATSSTSASTSTVTVALTGVAASAEPTTSAPSQAAPWPAWAITHLQAEDALRQEEHKWRGWLMLCVGVTAGLILLVAFGLAFLAIRQSNRAGGLQFTSHWGGFGGSTGGWQVAPAFVTLFAAIVLAATAVVIVGCMLGSTRMQAASEVALPSAPAAGEKKK